MEEMTDKSRIARFPRNDFRLAQQSSYDRDSVEFEEAKYEATGWFANFDRNSNKKNGNFERKEIINGREEYVVMEHTGPGAIVRTWMPWESYKKPGTNAIIRFYIDGKSEPALQGNMFDLLNGKGLIPYPLAHESLASAVSFFPIPYAKSMKVTVSEMPFFFQFTYRAYDADTHVKSFTMADYTRATELIEKTAQTLSNLNQPQQSYELAASTILRSGEQMSLALPAGNAAIEAIKVKLGNYDDAHITRHVIIKMSFDDKQTVWSPIGDFFGTGIGVNPFEDRYRAVLEDGTMLSSWVMPYQRNAMITLKNIGPDPVDVDLQANTGEWVWDDASMYFNAAWRGQYPVATRPYSDWNYVTLTGKGVYVGDSLTVMNPDKRWWGEGDEKIYVDGETFPSIFGTGTEDYYAYSWGGKSTDFYQHPFHAQPRANVYNKLNRKTTDERNTQGYSTETRVRALDTMPFSSSLKLDMEIWSWADAQMGYGVGLYWYADENTTSNRQPDEFEARNVPPLPN
ncbi:hypothetical protein GLIP_3863 [Aliiglaciecola lipolytica E3]|uniref:DUF2961 domain-containing protein n=2 Tax=Aliiglaciecola TaxID=1406885 RepID=K6X789_9ALTE|nr:hypothetical protein GLIP_3863 [Aliiglaciecola lipolytica E3]